MFLAGPQDSGFTFARPGEGDPFSFEVMRANAERIADLVPLAYRQARMVENSVAARDAMLEETERRIAKVREIAGVELENPFRRGYFTEARARVEEARRRGETVDAQTPPILQAQRAIFEEKIEEIRRQHPDRAHELIFGPIEEGAVNIAARADAEFEHALRDPDLGLAGRLTASLIGGLGAAASDPIQGASVVLGGGAGTARTVIGRIGQVALREALINAGTTAAMQPFVQDWRRQVGLEAGAEPALENVGLAFLIGAVPGAAAQIGREGLGALSRVLGGDPSPADVKAAVEAAGGRLRPEDEATLQAAARVRADAELSFENPPPGIAAEDHRDLMLQAARNAEDPLANPPPELPLVAPPRPQEQLSLLDEALPGPEGGMRVDGKPVSFERFDPRVLYTDAATFQYKTGGDAAGVTDRLRNVTRWDPTASGKTFVYERADGTRFIADGHQRRGLAHRLLEQDPGADIRLDGYLFRQKDGWTPADVRALAAKKNMQEGSGDAIDAARILRERPDLLDGALPVTGPMMKTAVALSRLSDEAFGMVLNGVVPANHAAAVGQMVANPLHHAATLADLARYQPETEREARLLIGEILEAGFTAEEQINLFGTSIETRSLMAERVRVLDLAMQQLRADKRLFGTLSAKASAIEAAGNRLARMENRVRAQGAATLEEVLTKIAQRAGPASDALSRAALKHQRGMGAKQAAKEFLSDIEEALNATGLNGLLHARPELKPRVAIEPASPEAAAQADALATAAPAAPADRAPATEPDMLDLVPSATREDGMDMRPARAEDALAGAERTEFLADLTAACRE